MCGKGFDKYKNLWKGREGIRAGGVGEGREKRGGSPFLQKAFPSLPQYSRPFKIN